MDPSAARYSREMSENLPDYRAMTADIVAAYVRGRNHVQVSELAGVIQAVHRALTTLSNAPETAPAVVEPAVSIRKAVTPDFVTCLACGKRFKALKRHIRTDHGQTPQEYRAQWGLPATFPMVAPNYAATRSALAVSMRLGQAGSGGGAAPSSGSGAGQPVQASAPKRRGRPPKGAA